MPVKDPTVTVLRCANCRNAVPVPATFGDGDILRCGVCGISLKVQRTGGLRLQVADAAPLREEVKSVQARLRGLETTRRRARARFGIGVNGLGVGLLYVLYQVGLKDEQWSSALVWDGAGVALLSGIGLEVANYFLLSKRRQLKQLSGDIEQAQADLESLESKIRDSRGD